MPFGIMSRYLGRQFLMAVLFLLAVLAGVVLIAEFVELFRRAGGHEDVTGSMALTLAVLKLPRTVEQIFHVAVLFGSMAAFMRLNRSRELVIARAAGMSVWQILAPLIVLAILIGVARVFVFNPVAATMFGQYEALEDRYFDHNREAMELTQNGFWLRQRNGDETVTIRATASRLGDVEITDVMVQVFGSDDNFIRRIDAREGRLEDGFWELTDAWATEGQQAPIYHSRLSLDTDLTRESIVDSFSRPETLAFWKLPDFIDRLTSAGFSAVRHQLHFHTLLAQPTLLVAMVLLSAVFSLRNPRRGGTLIAIIGAIIAGFLVFVVNDIVTAFGIAETIPVVMAAWTPPMVTLLIGAGLLLHREDG